MPRNGYYVVEVVYAQTYTQATVDLKVYVGVGIGVNNLAAIALNKMGFALRVVNGCRLKSWNQWYNKRKAKLQKKLGTTAFTRQLEQLTNKRNRRTHHFMHTASRRIIDLLVQEGRRVKRGLYQASEKSFINADINGTYNIIRKSKPDAFANGVAGYVVHPVRLIV